MITIKAVIIEDEPAAVDVLLELCQMDGNVQVTATASNGFEAVELLKNVQADLVFLDVDMPIMSGLEVLNQFQEHPFEIIFTTGSEEHAFQAFKFAALDYLLKPIDPAEFQNALSKFRLKKASTDKTLHRLAVPNQNGIDFLEEDEILYINSNGSYSYVFTTGTPDKIILSKNIGQVQEKLSAGFFRCHNSYLVNLKHVQKLINRDRSFLQMSNGDLIEVSRRNKADLLNALSSFSKK